MSVDDEIGQARRRIWEAAVWLDQMGLVAGSSGNISARVAGTELVAITPTDVRYSAIEPDDVVVVERSGEVVVGRHMPTSELPLHLAVYDARPDMSAIAHTHSPYATAFAVIREPIPLISNEGLGVRALEVEVAPFAIPGSRELADAVVAVLMRTPQTRAVLLANHGLLTVGVDLETACNLAHSIELEARVCQLARTMGEVHRFTQEQLDATVGEYIRPKKSANQMTSSVSAESLTGE
ncbi:MAG: class II aldolase/adducin family protein [Acidimicrobiia bacterium]